MEFVIESLFCYLRLVKYDCLWHFTSGEFLLNWLTSLKRTLSVPPVIQIEHIDDRFMQGQHDKQDHIGQQGPTTISESVPQIKYMNASRGLNSKKTLPSPSLSAHLIISSTWCKGTGDKKDNGECNIDEEYDDDLDGKFDDDDDRHVREAILCQI